MKRLFLFMICSVPLAASLTGCSPSSNNGAQRLDSDIMSSRELCLRTSGSWLVYNAPSADADRDCLQGRCFPIIGMLELRCNYETISGRMLIGMSSREIEPNQTWADVSLERTDNNLRLEFASDGCQSIVLLDEFKPDRLTGNITSKNCRILGKEVQETGKAIFVRAE